MAELLSKMKTALMVSYKSNADRGDFVYEVTAGGLRWISSAPASMPSFASRFDSSRPMPLDAPVTNAVR